MWIWLDFIWVVGGWCILLWDMTGVWPVVLLWIDAGFYDWRRSYHLYNYCRLSPRCRFSSSRKYGPLRCLLLDNNFPLIFRCWSFVLFISKKRKDFCRRSRWLFVEQTKKRTFLSTLEQIKGIKLLTKCVYKVVYFASFNLWRSL
jgi:hypothetical protein